MDRQRWTLKQLAAASGRAVNTCNQLALAGLVPNYQGRGIPAELAEPAAVALRHGAVTPTLARLVREDPDAVLAAAEALAALARAAKAAHSPLPDRREVA